MTCGGKPTSISERQLDPRRIDAGPVVAHEGPNHSLELRYERFSSVPFPVKPYLAYAVAFGQRFRQGKLAVEILSYSAISAHREIT